MKNNIFILVVTHFLFISISFAQSLESENYESYNKIVRDLHSELDATTLSTQEKLLNSSYSLAAGLQTQFLKINNTSESLFGFGGEIGIYNFLMVPLKIGLDFVSGTEVKSTLFSAKTDHSIYKYNLLDVKIGLAAGVGNYKKQANSFTSFYLAPSVASFYQLSRSFDINFNLSYAFHGSNDVADHISPSVNIVSYF